MVNRWLVVTICGHIWTSALVSVREGFSPHLKQVSSVDVSPFATACVLGTNAPRRSAVVTIDGIPRPCGGRSARPCRNLLGQGLHVGDWVPLACYALTGSGRFLSPAHSPCRRSSSAPCGVIPFGPREGVGRSSYVPLGGVDLNSDAILRRPTKLTK